MICPSFYSVTKFHFTSVKSILLYILLVFVTCKTVLASFCRNYVILANFVDFNKKSADVSYNLCWHYAFSVNS